MQARDVMTKQVVTVSPDTEVSDIVRLLLEKHVSALPVVDSEGNVLGLVSEGDLIRRSEAGTERHRSWWLNFMVGPSDLAKEYTKTHGVHARDIMTRPAVTAAADTPLGDIAELLERRRIKRVVIIEDDKLVGIVSRADLLRAMVAAKKQLTAPADDDRSIREALLHQLDEEPWVQNVHCLNVVVNNGVVHLWGLVESNEQKQALRVAAENVPGVRAVDEHFGQVSPWTWAY